MDDIKFLQLFNLVKMGIPGTTFMQLKDFLQAQDQERQNWFNTASLADVADWVVATMREQAR